MLGRIITAAAGGAIAKQVGGVAGRTVGMVAGAVLPGVLRRLGPVGMIAAAVGGYALTKVIEKRRAAGPTV